MQKWTSFDKKAWKDIGRRLRLEREILGYSQEEMAYQLGISDRQYRRYESGRSSIPRPYLLKLHDEMEIDINYLIMGVFVMDEYIQAAMETMPDTEFNETIDEYNALINYDKKDTEFADKFLHLIYRTMIYGYTHGYAEKLRDVPTVDIFKQMHEQEKVSVTNYKEDLHQILFGDRKYEPIFRFQQPKKE